MILELIEAGLLVSDYVYHRWFQDQPQTPNPGFDIKVPTTTAGATIPLFFGTCLIKTPVLAWWGPAQVIAGAGALLPVAAPWVYAVDQFYIAGIGFSGFAAVELKNIYAGELEFEIFKFDQSYGAYDGRGGISGTNYNFWPAEVYAGIANTTVMGGAVQFYHGHPDQLMVDASGNPLNDIAVVMLAEGLNPFSIPGYRGYASVGLYGRGTDTLKWEIGTEPQPPSYAFEMRSTPEGAGSGLFVTADGVDVNPMDIVYDLLTGTMGKLGMDPARLDSSSLTRCAETLANEGHGMSRYWEGGQNVKSYLDEIMKQIDGVYYEDPETGLFTVRLIRPDYDPTTCLAVNPSNCSSLDNLAASGWVDITNKIRVTYTNRSDHYRDGSATAQNQANAVGQSGEIREVQLQYPGVTQLPLAQTLADRELVARSRPLMKCRATVGGEFWRTTVGDVLMLTWPDANISFVPMRVAAVSRGTLQDGSILIDLIQDFFYVYRHRHPVDLGGGHGHVFGTSF